MFFWVGMPASPWQDAQTLAVASMGSWASALWLARTRPANKAMRPARKERRSRHHVGLSSEGVLNEERLDGFQNLALGHWFIESAVRAGLANEHADGAGVPRLDRVNCSAVGRTVVPARFPSWPLNAATPVSSIVDESVENV